jgi:hypothetical protein
MKQAFIRRFFGAGGMAAWPLWWLLWFMLTSAGIQAVLAGEARQYTVIDWVDLLPDDDLQALMNPPSWLLEVEDGSEEDSLDTLFAAREADAVGDRFMQALKSANVRPEMQGRPVRLPGFIVPLSFDQNRKVIEFFLVPYFGACLHLPPPPPNQIFYIEYGEGIEVENLQQPYWVDGELVIATTSNRTGSSAYSLIPASIEEYRE